MELLSRLLPIYTAYAAPAATTTTTTASTPTISSSLFTTITIGANTFVSIIKWAALLWLLVKITMLGFSIITEAKNSSDAFNKVKDQGVALLIGFFIVMTSFMIHSTLKDTVNSIGTAGNTSTSIDYNNDKDVFKVTTPTP